MAFLKKKNNAKSTVADNPLTAGATTVNLQTGDGVKFPASGDFLMSSWNKAVYDNPGNDPNMEIVRGTARTSDAITIVRGQEGTTPVAHPQGSAIEMLITAGTLDEAFDQNMKTTDKPTFDDVTVISTDGIAFRMFGAGEDGGGTDNSNGCAIVLSHNTSGNRQFWFGDTESKLGIRIIGSSVTGIALDGYNYDTNTRQTLYLGAADDPGGASGTSVIVKKDLLVRNLFGVGTDTPTLRTEIVGDCIVYDPTGINLGGLAVFDTSTTDRNRIFLINRFASTGSRSSAIHWLIDDGTGYGTLKSAWELGNDYDQNADQNIYLYDYVNSRLVWQVDSSGYFKANVGYKSADGSAGVTTTCTVKVSGVDKTMTIKNGIITSIA